MAGTNAETLAKRVQQEVGFYLFSPTVTGFAGVQVSTDVTLVCGLDGNIIRRATEDDIKKWNATWSRIADELFRQSKS